MCAALQAKRRLVSHLTEFESCPVGGTEGVGLVVHPFCMPQDEPAEFRAAELTNRSASAYSAERSGFRILSGLSPFPSVLPDASTLRVSQSETRQLSGSLPPTEQHRFGILSPFMLVQLAITAKRDSQLFGNVPSARRAHPKITSLPPSTEANSQGARRVPASTQSCHLSCSSSQRPPRSETRPRSTASQTRCLPPHRRQTCRGLDALRRHTILSPLAPFQAIAPRAVREEGALVCNPHHLPMRFRWWAAAVKDVPIFT